PADAQTPPSATSAATKPNGGGAPRALELRLSMSPSAAGFLSETRVRRLVEIELDEGVLAPGTGGPLGDYVAYVWIDRPNAAQIVIEARVGDRPVVRRGVPIGG